MQSININYTLIVYKKRKCDKVCYNAMDKKCNCICNGLNHGKGLKTAMAQTTKLLETGKLKVINGQASLITENTKLLLGRG